MGLRERKKEMTRRAIVGAARALLFDRGYAATTMEDVAGAADVSVGTLYNYFSSKQALLVAVFEAETETMLAAGQAIVDAPPKEPEQGVIALLNAYADQLFAIPPALVEEIVAFGFGGGEVTDELVSIDVRLMSQFADLVGSYHSDGRIRADVLVDDAVLIAYSVLFANLVIYTSVAGFDLEMARSHIVRQVDVIFKGLEPSSKD